MMRKSTILPPRPARDAGVALIIALAVLALLLVMLIGFLASSILEHRIAYNQSSQVASRLAVRSAMTRVQFQLKNYGDDLAWFRTEDNIDNKVIAPLVSSCDGKALSSAKTTPDKDTCAMSALTPLLEYYLTVKNYFPKIDSDIDKTDYYPQWIDLKVNLPPPSGSSTETHLTGRYAYVVIPNLGIAPAVMGSGSTARVGGDIKELPLTGLLTDAGITRVTSLDQWLSFELMTGGKGIYNGPAFYNITNDVKGEFDTNSVTRRELANFYFTPDVWKFAEKSPSSNGKWLAHGGAGRINLKGKQFTLSDLTMLTGADGLFGDFGDVKEQVAANLIDYTDSDDTPTSDVAPSEWKTSTDDPKYTGNECTPYINQIVPMVQVRAVYSVPQVSLPTGSETNYSVERKLKVSYCGDLVVELVNIYPRKFPSDPAKSVEFKGFIKGLKITGKVTLAKDNGAGGVEELEAANFTLGGDDAEITTKTLATVGARSYAVMSLPDDASILIFQQLAPTPAFAPYFYTTTDSCADLADLPKWYVTATVESVTFNRAVLSWKDEEGTLTNVDYVKGTPKTPSNKLFINQADVDCFKSASTTGDVSELRNGSAYLSFEAVDPRCNLDCGDNDCWKLKEFMADKAELTTDAIPNYQDCNSVAEARNNKPDQEKDLEPNNDPKQISTAYIRNAAMQSPWELALIHRGTPWQTVNLRSALHPMAAGYDSKKGSYLNDAILLEKIKFSADSEACKFNIDLPAQHESAFGVLTKGLQYHDPTKELEDDAGSLVVHSNADPLPQPLQKLSDDAAKELAKWIAYKCYDAGGTDPTADSAKHYQRYLHRGLLANVIMDWARNGAKSPFKGDDKPLKEAHLSELVGKIVPLTRCGDTYEYFTVFAVGQAIKDFGGTNKFYKYNNDGTLKTTPSSATWGKFDLDIDQITAQTYLVARIRREITHCEGKDCCKLGIHDPGCTFKLTVLESYTLDEL